MIYPRYNIYNKKILKNFFTKKIPIIKFENKFKEITNLKNVIALNFARTGLFYAIKKIISKNKNVILLSPFTIFDIVNVVISAGAKPKFIDLNINNPHISKKQIFENIDIKTAGVLITHYHTVNPETEEIIELCNKNKIKIIEDCAISFGGKYNKSLQHVGSKSDYAIFSFGIFKTISTISGGILHVKNFDEFKEIKKNVSQQKKTTVFNLILKTINKLKFQIFLNKIFFNLFFFHVIKYSEILNFKNVSKFLKNDPNPIKINIIPNNYLDKISNYQLAEIFTQLDNYTYLINNRITNAKIIEENLKSNENLILPNINDKCDTVQCYPILIKNSKKENLYKYLLKCNFDVSKYYYRNCSSLSQFNEFGSNCINSEFYSGNVLVIPCYPEIKKEYLINLCNKINIYFINEKKN